MTLLMAAFAAVAIEQAMVEPGRSRWPALIWTIGGLIVPAVLAALALNRGYLAGCRDRARVGILLSLIALPFLGEAWSLVATGRCHLAEVPLLAALRNLVLGLSAWSRGRAESRAAALASVFLVTAATAVGGDGGPAVMVPVLGFAAAGIGWLMGVYWQGLNLDGNSGVRIPQVAAAACALGLAASLGLILAMAPARAADFLACLIPSSGGDRWSDPDSSSGVGDGDNEVAASEHPQSVGFTASDVYLETDKPSLYDAFNETYGEPFKPRPHQKMIAMGPQDVGELKEPPAENLRAGREFAAVRRRPSPRAGRPRTNGAEALVYVKGATPLHLPLAAYSHFDGTSWREQPCCGRIFDAEKEAGGSWLRLPWREAPYLAGIASHQVKIGTLDSSPLAIPPHACRIRVGAVDRLDFFGWAQAGILRMTDRPVPAGTVIEAETRTVYWDRLHAQEFAGQSPGGPTHDVDFDGYSIDAEVAELARAWTTGVPSGWACVEAITARLRRDFVHDRAATMPETCDDIVAEFLLRSRRGPDYLFASAAAVLIRSLGYPARVVSGLYADPARYDPRTRHTAVAREDVHFWVEVRLPDACWICVEPTPGYDLAAPVDTWSNRLATALARVRRWLAEHAIGLAVAAMVTVLTAIRRTRILDALATLAYTIRPGVDPRRRILGALRLVERRARWAGLMRPPGLTPARWYPRFATAGEPLDALDRLIHLAGWAVHAADGVPAQDPPDSTCRDAIRAWTLDRFRAAGRRLPENTKEDFPCARK
ncbi:transglutaminase-like domain-containing protein [Aquisphaera insulae]|uniref:transglutaminase-like domain-containing protein n=1 Tax=Aquisphaera insulae TaxID=2712864 RepID=UPI0013EC98DE|nr:transglutaminase-like domain-containing protein [Aquisphaera insulae]